MMDNHILSVKNKKYKFYILFARILWILIGQKLRMDFVVLKSWQ